MFKKSFAICVLSYSLLTAMDQSTITVQFLDEAVSEILKDPDACFLVWEESKLYINPERIEMQDEEIYLKRDKCRLILLPELRQDDSGYYVSLPSIFDTHTLNALAQSFSSSPYIHFNRVLELNALLCRGSVEIEGSRDSEGNSSIIGKGDWQSNDDSWKFEIEGKVKDQDGKTSGEVSVTAKKEF